MGATSPIKCRGEAIELNNLIELAGTEFPRDVKQLIEETAQRRGEFAPTFGRRR